MVELLFEDIFTLTRLEPDGKKFDKVVLLHFRELYASFGGLLMMLKGDPSNAAQFELDQRLFLLMRKV
ncbi:hypothetical protein BHE74_00051275 [Ensete ventricosum]|nr:hypothetical protein GW17_00023344 [Ensete ventricosum]RWW43101.1 hypothetical protein BHE74_00051275 [Ensete ventricosum]RZR86558.1 hypothetical protein BHM03_00013781 [Ensete ventricosum]